MSETLSWANTRDVLTRYCPEVAADVCDLFDAPLSEYAARILIPPERERTFDEDRLKVRQAIAQFMKTSGNLDAALEEDVINDFFAQNVVLTGPHLQVLLDAEPFYGLIMAALGLSSSDKKYIYWHANTTGRLNLANKSGPGWLKIDDYNINLFDLPVRRMNSITPFGSKGMMQFKPTVANMPVDKSLAPLFEDIGRSAPQELRKLFHSANDLLWDVDDHKLPKLVIFDDLLNSILMRIHLQDPDSLINKILFDRACVSLQKNLFDAEAQLPVKSMLPFGTDFFWYNRGDKFVPMHLDGKYSVLANTEEEYSIHWQPEAISDALLEKKIVPNVYLMMLIFSILPSIRVNGGPRQVMYMPSIHRIAAKVLGLILGSQLNFDVRRLHGLGSDVIYPKPGLIAGVARARTRQGIVKLITDLRGEGSSFSEQTQQLRTIREYGAWQAVFAAME